MTLSTNCSIDTHTVPLSLIMETLHSSKFPSRQTHVLLTLT